MPSVFISYKRGHSASEQVARLLEDSLRFECDVLRDTAIAPGAAWSKQLYTWLLECDAAIAIVSHEANTADWCRREWSVLAARREVADLLVIAVHVDDAIIPTDVLDDVQALAWSPHSLTRLRARLAELKPRSTTAKDFLAAHLAWLRWQFREERVLGQEPFALADVYIQTECGELRWGDVSTGVLKAKRDPFNEANGGRHDLVETVLSRMADPSFRDLVVVQAGPGSGKTAFTLRLAAALMDLDFTPIVVRFRDLRLATFHDVGELLDDAIRIGHTDDDSPAATVPVVSELLNIGHMLEGTSICRSVLILDGWDEVSLTGNIDYQSQLRSWLPRLREYFIQRRATHPIRVVLTGRPSAEVGESGMLLSTTPVFTIRPMRPEQLRTYASHVRDSLAKVPESAWSIDLERLRPVFAAYDAWFARYKTGTADSNSSGDILGNPLLAYLTLRVMAESGVDAQTVIADPSALYHELIEAIVKHACKFGDTRTHAGVHRGGECLRYLLHEVASTITIMRCETVSYAELQARFEDPGLPIERARLSDWAQTPDTRNALRELVVNFYFKGGHTAFGCEFLHKSFREYLFAEAVVTALCESTQPERADRYALLEYWQDFQEGSNAFRLSRRLGYLLSRQWLSPEVEQHLTWLLRANARSNPEIWQRVRDLVVEVYAWWGFSVHLRHQPGLSRALGPRWSPPFIDTLFCWAMPLELGAEAVPARTSSLDAHLGHALARIACVLHEALPEGTPSEGGRRRHYQSLHQGRLLFRPGGRGHLRQLIARMDTASWRRGYSLTGVVSGPVDLSDEEMDLAYCIETDLSGAVLHGARYMNSIFANVDLSGADLSSSIFPNARLSECIFANANFADAKLGSADFWASNLTGADFRRADLEGACFDSATLTAVNLSCADLREATLIGADLTDANLAGADLSGANFQNAKLDGANLTGVDSRGASFDGVDLALARLDAGAG